MADSSLPSARRVPSFQRRVWPGPFGEVLIHTERLKSDALWSRIDLLAEVRTKGEKLFHGSPAQKRRRWVALNDFCRQGKAYNRALEKVEGTERGLLGYYGALNLAKAELLHHTPDEVIDRRIGHGLHYPVGSLRSINTDYVQVLPRGIFPLLYRARTGASFPANTRIPVRRVLSQIPELSEQYMDAFGKSSNCFPCVLRIAIDDTHIWPILAVEDQAKYSLNAPGYSALLRYFERVGPPLGWEQLFSVTERDPSDFLFLECKKTFAIRDGVLPISDAGAHLQKTVGPLLNSPGELYRDLNLTFRPYSTKRYPLPNFLARYIAMYYLSSLVRYQPSRLNPSVDSLAVWLLEEFARHTPLSLLVDAFDGITQRSNRFER